MSSHIDSDRDVLDNLTRALCAYVNHHGLKHHIECPEDDTCECPHVLALSHALDAAVALVSPRDPKKLRLRLDSMEELALLTDQVTRLQAAGTEQLMAARVAALETAALECEKVARRYFDNGHNGTPILAETMREATTGMTAAETCASDIRALYRPPVK